MPDEFGVRTLRGQFENWLERVKPEHRSVEGAFYAGASAFIFLDSLSRDGAAADSLCAEIREWAESGLLRLKRGQ